MMKKKGKVYLVGAGPGDPGLLTVKGLECLKQADVIVYDRLLDDSLLELARPGAEKIYVGKSAGWHTLKQEEINELLVGKAGEGKGVVRLKGGDPFVLGRGGEEVEALAGSRVPFKVVPGVSSATAVPAYAGIPLTHRELASSFIVATGHEAGGKDDAATLWDKLGTGAGTLVFLMGVTRLRHIVKALLDNGRHASTPVALIADGTTNRQRVLIGTLENIAAQAEKVKLKPPAVIVVGEVVRLREKLGWFENKPLFGKRILVTRARRQAKGLSRLLLERGAVPVEMPAIKIKPLSGFGELDREVLNLKSYHWMIFTSINGVEAFFLRLHVLGLDARWLGGISIGAIGPGTAGALEEKGVRADFMPEKYTSRSLVAGLQYQGMDGKRVLLPRAGMAGRTLAEGLISLGAQVCEVIAYETIPDDTGLYKLEQMLKDGQIDVITFASASAVKSLLTVLDKKTEIMNRTLLACIGPETEAALKRAGLRAGLVAQVHTMAGLVEAMEQYFGEVRDG
jgi:uroporphyrinogen III methyltransferase/synthase